MFLALYSLPTDLRKGLKAFMKSGTTIKLTIYQYTRYADMILKAIAGALRTI